MLLYVYGFPSDVAALRAPPIVRCPRCPLAAHPACLARRFLREEPRELLPLRGNCPRCHAHPPLGRRDWLQPGRTQPAGGGA
ncbi:hypothetical protein Q9966_016548 [Columba livia]|nr:hypothetical protein Q9966_016548 [Columba livia]